VTVSVIATLSPDAESVAVEESSVWNRRMPLFDVVTVVLTKCWNRPIFAIVCGGRGERRPRVGERRDGGTGGGAGCAERVAADSAGDHVTAVECKTHI
jgi:hypothetical protein